VALEACGGEADKGNHDIQLSSYQKFI
jgi:hypothetical protein